MTIDLFVSQRAPVSVGVVCEALVQRFSAFYGPWPPTEILNIGGPLAFNERRIFVQLLYLTR